MQDTGAHDLEHAIWSAQPHELPDVAVNAVKACTGATAVRILLADYRQSRLIPVREDEPDVAVDNTAPGHAFAAQQIIADPEDEHTLHLPLSVHGDRLGVLSVTLPGDAAGEPRTRLALIATVLARALKLADAHTDLYRRIRRRSRLTLAAEMQWELLPGRACSTGEFHLAGHLEPAYAVWGDNFDWSVSERHLTLTITNGMGSGTAAAALTHLAISALRNARRSGAGLAEQAALADQTLYAHHRGDRYLSTLLLDFDLVTGRARVVDAGSPKAFRLRGNTTEALDFDAQLPLGMFGDSHYSAEEFAVEPGDRLIIVSDGVHAAASDSGELYGTVALMQAIRETRLQNPPEAVRTFIRHFLEYHGGAEPADDAVVVCLDWTGKTSAG
ncbi:PP2C family protein-serine/threonine phosphatase [Actinomadura macrotermitis]|uniref:PPM-type phosphatase domain-containing protein n=1 Tax=Actinomadura macrotermitis TaxID=2585200 RepID=A0A7K0BUK7_9ACTN|nr:PP2C family protein-serine/threonine phosphatase [Actinomadura macrotermitis]MQY04890.1 hypothetical protein [Actinomadura macrotermitis]